MECPTGRFSDLKLRDRTHHAAEMALIRSWQGPRWDRLGTSGSPAKVLRYCPIHNYELSATGFCLGCDDVAPAL